MSIVIRNHILNLFPNILYLANKAVFLMDWFISILFLCFTFLLYNVFVIYVFGLIYFWQCVEISICVIKVGKLKLLCLLVITGSVLFEWLYYKLPAFDITHGFCKRDWHWSHNVYLICDPYGTYMGPISKSIWAPHGTHMGFANGIGIGPIMCIWYVTHIGPISNTHMRPTPFAKPIWGTHIDSNNIMGPILVPYGLAIWDPYGLGYGLFPSNVKISG